MHDWTRKENSQIMLLSCSLKVLLFIFNCIFNYDLIYNMRRYINKGRIKRNKLFYKIIYEAKKIARGIEYVV